MTDTELLAIVERFLALTGMKPTRFGREAMRDGSFVMHLRAGRSPSLANVNKVLAFIREYRPDTAEPSRMVA